MMPRQNVGRRYLAGFVIGSAGAYLAATCAISIKAWQDTYPMWLVTNWLTLGLVPAAAALALGIKAWSADTVALSALALLILLVALALWQIFVVSF